MLPAPHRLRSSSDFRAAVRGVGGSRSGGRLVVVHRSGDHRAGEQPVRVGFVVSKAVGNAVVRNRAKRRLRALIASRLPGLPGGTDLVVRANRPAADATAAQLGAELDRLLARVLREAGR